MTTEKRNEMYKKVLRNNNLLGNHPTINTDLKMVNPDEIVDVIHKNVDTRLWDNIKNYFTIAVFTGVPITRTNLDYGSYIQLERVDAKHGNGGYIIKLYIGRGDCDNCYALFADKITVINIIQSIQDAKFFAKWRRKLAAADFDYEEFEPYDSEMSTFGAAFI